MDNVYFLRCMGLLAVVVVVFADDLSLNATVGQKSILPCHAEKLMPFEIVEWSRPGIVSEYVLLVHTKIPDPEIPGKSYKGRVDLSNMQTGDVSLILKNVTEEDRGRYECYVVSERNRRKRAIRPVSTIYLDVISPPYPGNKDTSKEDGGNQDGPGFGRYRVMVACPLIIAGVVWMVAVAIILSKKMKSSPDGDTEKPPII